VGARRCVRYVILRPRVNDLWETENKNKKKKRFTYIENIIFSRTLAIYYYYYIIHIIQASVFVQDTIKTFKINII